MKPKRFTIFRKLTSVMFVFLAVLGILFITITYFATTYYHQASTQLLNKDVAAHISKYTSPFTDNGINKEKADSVFQNAMVLSPAAEVYFLDTSGEVIYFHASEKDILEWHVDPESLKKYISEKGERYIIAADPRDPGHNKIFSAAIVKNSKGQVGYIYVILDSKKSEGIMSVLLESHIVSLTIKSFLIILGLSFVFSFFYLNRVQKSFQKMIDVLQRFEAGDYDARFDLKRQDELLPVTHAFNKMAELLSYNINQLKGSEQERKNFIASISHDLRTPLSIARGYTETLLMKHKNITEPDEDHYEQLIYGKLIQIENMVKQLFELSKMDAVEFKPQIEPFVFSEIVQEAVYTHQLVATEKKVNLIYTGCNDIVWIRADISMVERVVQNLVDNALKNTPENGSTELSIAVSNGRVIFTIVNDGAALSDALLYWINGKKDTENLYAGRPQKAGLGLVIVQRILNLHQTTLKASITNHRNVFSFWLPVYKPTI